jgi:hypothetical protein
MESERETFTIKYTPDYEKREVISAEEYFKEDKKGILDYLKHWKLDNEQKIREEIEEYFEETKCKKKEIEEFEKLKIDLMNKIMYYQRKIDDRERDIGFNEQHILLLEYHIKNRIY